MTATRPRLSPSVVLAPSEKGYLAFETKSERLHQLNPMASLIVDLCDGTRDRDGLMALLRPLIGEDGTIAADAWIRSAARDGLLVDNDSAAMPPSAEALSTMVNALRDCGRILPAFVCQRRVTELLPEDAPAWCQLGELSHILGRRDEARTAYEQYQRLHPDDAEIDHILRALRDETPPPRATDECVTRLYARFASFYDSSMCDDLGYEAPDRLESALRATLAGRRDLDVLELGCGTGLAGLRLRALARRLVGIDLSPEMLEHARRRNLYDALHQAEITDWLQRTHGDETPRAFDLIAACDALIYFGDLAQVLAPASRRLTPGGLLAFTVEQSPAYPFRLNDSGRFAHHRDHIAETATANRLSLARLEEATLRFEYGEPVLGLVAVLRADVSSAGS